MKKLDDAILTLEKRIEENSKGHTALDYLSYIAKIFALIKLLSGDSDFH
ncbi:hypothetical protein ECP02989423_2243 [Escherichia coli P0298942.3]|nr:hypothetical protein ECP02989423_2243 [Escherichia coli P0298942.3]